MAASAQLAAIFIGTRTMAIRNRYVVLFFTNGPYPTDDESIEARDYGPHVMFRNTRFISENDGCEPCTAVAGHVPAQYKRAFPAAVSYSDWIAGKLPTPATAPTLGEMALGADLRSFASRVLPDGPRTRDAAPTEAMQADPGLTGTETPPPPPMAPRGSLTGAIDLPPPPPPPPEG